MDAAARRTRGTTYIPAIIALLVVAALGLLVLRGAMQRLGTTDCHNKAPADIHVIERVCDEFEIENDDCSPLSLAELSRSGAAVRAQFGAVLPRDPWGREYRYEPPSTEFDFPRIFTYGRDGLPGGTGDDADLGNWMLR